MCPTNWLAAAWGRARRRGHSPQQGRGTRRRRGPARGWILADEAFTCLRAEQLVVTQRAPQNFFCNISRGSARVSFAVRCAYVTVCAKIKHSDRPRSGKARLPFRGIWSHSARTRVLVRAEPASRGYLE